MVDRVKALDKRFINEVYEHDTIFTEEEAK